MKNMYFSVCSPVFGPGPARNLPMVGPPIVFVIYNLLAFQNDLTELLKMIFKKVMTESVKVRELLMYVNWARHPGLPVLVCFDPCVPSNTPGYCYNGLICVGRGYTMNHNHFRDISVHIFFHFLWISYKKRIFQCSARFSGLARPGTSPDWAPQLFLSSTTSWLSKMPSLDF